MTRSEALKIRANLEIAAQSLDDAKALEMKMFYNGFWDIVGKTVKQGFKFIYDGKLYKTVQPELTILAHLLPGVGTESLYTVIDEIHNGSKDDPIPYDGNMELEQGKYYTQDGMIYLCIRDTGTAVHNALRDLIGLYVEEVGE
mgnify:CR=1 FL=1